MSLDGIDGYGIVVLAFILRLNEHNGLLLMRDTALMVLRPIPRRKEGILEW